MELSWPFCRHFVLKDRNCPYCIDRECAARKEIDEMVATYRKRYPYGNVGFLVGSSLCGNKEGDSARFWKLKRILGET